MARILLADDDVATRDIVRRALEAEGHSVAVCEDGAAALDALKSSPQSFELMITDVEMPSLDGISLIAQAMAHAPALRVILMSGYPDQLARAANLKPRVLRLVSKPFTLEHMRGEVRAALA